MTDFTKISNEIENIFEKILYFIETYENYPSKSDIEVVKKSFDAARTVENIIKEIEKRSLLEQFLTCLNTWLYSKNITLIYNDEFYRLSFDQLLIKNLCNKNQVELSIKLYTLYCSKERFQNVIEKAILRNRIYEPILNYTVINKQDVDIVELKCRLILFQWKHDIQCGKKQQVINAIKDMFAPFTIDEQLPYLIRIFVLHDLCNEEKNIRSIIYEELLNKMDDRSILSKEFWLTILQVIDKKILSEVCSNFDKFLDKFISFLIYCGCMMDSEIHEFKRIWIMNIKSICPDVTFETLSSIFICLVNYNKKMSNYIKMRIDECKKYSDSLIWNDIINICF